MKNWLHSAASMHSCTTVSLSSRVCTIPDQLHTKLMAVSIGAIKEIYIENKCNIMVSL